MTSSTRLLTRRRAIALTLTGLITAPGPALALDSDVARVLAPSGRLRAGLYTGTPTSMVNDTDKDPRGVGYEIGRELARKLHVDYEPVVFSKNAEVQQALPARSMSPSPMPPPPAPRTWTSPRPICRSNSDIWCRPDLR